MILLASSRAQMFLDEEKTINENQTYTVRGVINVVHLPIPDGDQHGTEQGSVTGGYFFFLYSSHDVSPHSRSVYGFVRQSY